MKTFKVNEEYVNFKNQKIKVVDRVPGKILYAVMRGCVWSKKDVQTCKVSVNPATKIEQILVDGCLTKAC